MDEQAFCFILSHLSVPHISFPPIFQLICVTIRARHEIYQLIRLIISLIFNLFLQLILVASKKMQNVTINSVINKPIFKIIYQLNCLIIEKR